MVKEKNQTEKEKLDERRKEVLSKGKKFRYPMQHAKHRLVLITVVIAVLAVIVAGVTGWALLYKMQDTGDVLYRLTRVVPVPVAEIDGEKVRYSDYLMIYRSSITPVERQGSAGSLADFEGMKDYYKRGALNSAEDFAVAIKFAREMGVSVSDAEVNEAFDEHRTAGGTDRSKDSFLKVLSDNFGMDESEYRRLLYLNLLKMKVAQAMDVEAEETATKVEKLLAENGSFERAQEELGDKIVLEQTGQMVSILNVDGGRAEKAASMEKGAISERFVSNSGDGYYFVKLVEKNDKEVSYVSIKVPFTSLNSEISQIRKDGKVKEYIDIPKVFDEQK
ncbi:SurA N-terminal domain-containing protein [Candidatus Saccharibacteria bacterium]|nr:SurA N-terminal domain-containing protein [Candidatus Saccharibacteria bacterium]